MKNKLNILIKILYILLIVLTINLGYLIYKINQPKAKIFYNEDNIEVIKHTDLITEENEKILNKIANLENIKWGYYTFDRKTVNGGFTKDYYNEPIIVISQSLKHKESKRQNTILHEFSHYLLNEHNKAPEMYQELDTKNKEIMTDITAYTIDDYFFNGNTFKGSYLRKKHIKKHKEMENQVKQFISIIKEEIDND